MSKAHAKHNEVVCDFLIADGKFTHPKELIHVKITNDFDFWYFFADVYWFA